MELKEDENFAVLTKAEYSDSFENENNKDSIKIINVIKSNPEEIRKIINEDEKEEKEEKDNGEKE